VLKAVGPVKPREAKPTKLFPYRGTGVQSNGSVTLALYGRLMHKAKPDGPMMLDSVTLGPAEWARFTPLELKSGTAEWAVPEGVARKLARSLSPGDSGGVFRPEDFRQAELKAKVESIEGAIARVR